MERTRTAPPELTDRQREVLRLIARGHTNTEIAAMLGISLAGAKWHVSELLGKFNVQTREELAERWEREHGIGAGLRRWWSALALSPWSKVSAATLAGGVAIGATALLISAAGSANPAAEEFAAPTATPTPTPTPTPIPEPTIPDPDPLLAVVPIYDRAADEVMACAAAQGVEITKTPGDRLRKPSFTFSAPTLAEGEVKRGVLVGCEALHLVAAEAEWNAALLAHREAREIESSRMLATCMRDAGFAVAGDRATREEANQWALIDPEQPQEAEVAQSQAWRDCDAHIVAEVGMGIG